MSIISSLASSTTKNEDSMPAAVDTKDTTVFVEDSPAAESMGKTIIPDDELDFGAMSIKDFLAKPIIVERGVWLSSDVAGSELLGGLFPPFRLIDAYLKSRDLWADKLKGFQLMSSTAVIRLQVNANPFQSGRIGLRVLPMAERYRVDPLLESGYENMRNCSLATKFQQPHCELDCRDTTCTLKVPYLAPTNYYALNGDAYDRGNMFLTVMAPLREGADVGVSEVNWTIYLSFEDVKLSANIIPQAGRLSKTIGEMETDAVMKGPVEKALDIGVNVASTLSNIPILSEVAANAGWAMRAAKCVASYFGWSKPMISGAPQPFVNQAFRYSATADGASPAYPVGISSTNSLDIKDSVAYTNDDEMSWSFLKAVPVFTKTIQWSADTGPDSTLALYKLGPNQDVTHTQTTLNDSTFTSSRTVFAGGPVFYFHPLFKYYRGSLRICIKMAKTTMHSGRLMFIYTPRRNFTPSSTLADSAFAYRHVVDIRDGNVVDLKLPYMSEFGYLPIDDWYGTLEIKVLNKLRAPITASQTIDLMVWVSGDKDFEYAVPAGANTLLAPIIPQSGSIEKAPPVSGAAVLVDESIGSSQIKNLGVEHAQSCIGEMFTSVRSLLKRSSRVFLRGTSLDGASTITVRPYFASVLSFDASQNLSPSAGGDYYSYLAPMYTFLRGSTRITCFDFGFDSDFAATIEPYPSTSTSEMFKSGGTLQGELTSVDWATSSNGPAGTALATGLSDKAAFHIPYYNRTKISVIPYSSSDSYIGYVDESVPEVGLTISNSSSTFNNTGFYREVGEDFQFSAFVGCPPLSSKSISFSSDGGDSSEPLPLRRKELKA